MIKNIEYNGKNYTFNSTAGIIIDGAENVGKTTLCNKLSDILGLKIIHFSKRKGIVTGKFDYFEGYFYDINKNKRHGLIFDRQFTTEIVYSIILKRPENINDEKRDKLVEMFNNIDYKFILLDSNIPWDNERRQQIDENTNNLVKKQYNELFDKLKFNKKIKIDVTNENYIEKILNFISQ